MLGNLVRRIKYGKASKIEPEEVKDIVSKLENVYFEMDKSAYSNSKVSERPMPEDPSYKPLPRSMSERMPIHELSIQAKEFNSQILKLYSVSGKDILKHLTDDRTLMPVRLEHRIKTKVKTTQHSLWIEKAESDPVFNPRYETYYLSGTSKK